jgi:hypothetical protein
VDEVILKNVPAEFRRSRTEMEAERNDTEQMNKGASFKSCFTCGPHMLYSKGIVDQRAECLARKSLL